MSFEWAIGAACLRGLVVAMLTHLLARLAARGLTHTTGGRRRAMWVLLWLPFLMPGLFVGYAYNGWTLFLANSELWRQLPAEPCEQWRASLLQFDGAWNELLLIVLLTARGVAVGVLVDRLGTSAAMSRSAIHTRWLALGRRGAGGQRWRFRIRMWVNSLRRGAPSVGLLFLLAFQEFELAARLARPAWTVWLIDAQATGVRLERMLWLSTLTAAGQGLVLLLIVAGLRRAPCRPGVVEEPSPCLTGLGRVVLTLWVALSLGLVCVVPAVWVGGAFPMGIRGLWGRPTTVSNLAREIAVGLLVSGLAAAVALWWAARFARGERAAPAQPAPGELPHFSGMNSLPASSSWLRWGGWAASQAELVVSVAAIAVGSAGALPISLGLLAGLQTLGAGSWGRTALPWLTAQTLLLLPRGVLLVLVLRRTVETPGLHLARLLAGASDRVRQQSGGELTWRMSGLRWLSAAGVLWYGGYLDLATGQLLAPTGMASAPVTLYIQMHYGRNAVLSAMTFITVLAPVVVAWVILRIRPMVMRGLMR